MSDQKTITAVLDEQERETIRQIVARHVRVFGSVACGESGPASDIDLLVDKGEETSPWFPAGLILELEETLGRNVDVVTKKGLSPYIRDRILQEAVPL